MPPKVGSKRPADLVDQLRLAWKLRGLDVGSAADATRLFAMSIGDLLREWFETDAVQAMLAVNGVIGTWAGPEAPGTAYVMLHHSIGDVGTGNVGAWGYPEGGMGAVSESIRRAAESFGAVVRTDAPVERILTTAGRVTGVALRSGEELSAPVVVAATHPQLTFLRQLDPGVLPDDFLARMRHWRSRSGTVKVNLASVGAARLRRRPGHRTSSPTTPGPSSWPTRSSTSRRRSRRPAAARPPPARSATGASPRPSIARSAPRARTS